MGIILRVTQDVSMYGYLWGPSQAMLDPLASLPRQPFASFGGSPLAYRGAHRVS